MQQPQQHLPVGEARSEDGRVRYFYYFEEVSPQHWRSMVKDFFDYWLIGRVGAIAEQKSRWNLFSEMCISIALACAIMFSTVSMHFALVLFLVH